MTPQTNSRPIRPRSIGASLLTASTLAISLLLSGPAAATRNTADPIKPQAELPTADTVEGNYLAAVVAGAARDTDAAAVFFREVMRRDPKNDELVERAFVAFLASGATAEAFKAGERVLLKSPTNGLAHLALGVKDFRAKQFGRARAHLSQGGRGRAADITATLLGAWTWAASGDTKKALDTVDRLKGENAFNLFRDYHAGLIAAVGGNLDEAEKRLKLAYEQERTTLRVVDAYGRFASRRGDKDIALTAYRGFDALAPRHPIVRDAIAKLEAGRKLDPLVGSAQEGAAEVLYGLGAAGTQQGDELAAMIYLRLALYLDPQHVMALITLGDILERLKQPERALDVFNRIPQDSPVRANADIQIGLGLEGIGRSEEAQKHLEALITERPGNVEAWIALGNVYRSRKDFAKAAETYTKAVEQIGEPEPGNWTLFYFRGISYERSKQWPKAEADFKKALALAPDSQARERAVVLNYLGYSWVDQHMNLDEAFQMLQKAVELRPRDGYIVDSLGWAYYRLGRYEDAVRELEKAVELKPSDPTINDHLGDAYWKVGRKLEAKFQWNHARDLKPEPEDLTRILAKIDNGLPDETPAAAEMEKKAKSGG